MAVPALKKRRTNETIHMDPHCSDRDTKTCSEVGLDAEPYGMSEYAWRTLVDVDRHRQNCVVSVRLKGECLQCDTRRRCQRLHRLLSCEDTVSLVRAPVWRCGYGRTYQCGRRWGRVVMR